MSIADNAQALALLIDGQDVPSTATRTVYDPATGEPLAEVADATAADAERAVAAARAAFRSGVWSRVTPAEQGREGVDPGVHQAPQVHRERRRSLPWSCVTEIAGQLERVQRVPA